MLHFIHLFILYYLGSSSGTVVAVVVVCVALLVGVIAVAVVKIRNVNNSSPKATNVSVEDGPEMEWDNSTLNITVNPLEGVSHPAFM